mmetsp:Transcript_27249/g.46025  ORF Transcript_27249/g.46025 Transcript_27249/m.46025 type:complete len:363 (+) Transcript_27249:1704-2792(+)
MVVTKMAKRVAWCVVVALNIYFVYFSVLRGITRSVSWQTDYVMVCFAELLVEIFLYETVECLWIHYMLPSLVSEDVETIMNTVKDTIHVAFVQQPSTAAAPLNAPRFFFPSYQLAQSYPGGFESSIVLAFHSYFPPPELDVTLTKASNDDDTTGDVVVGKRRVGRGNRKTSIATTLFKWFSLGVVVFSAVQHLATTPIRLQKVVVHTLQPIVLSFVAICYIFFVNSPEMLLIPLGIVVLQVIIYTCRPQEDRPQKLNARWTSKSEPEPVAGANDSDGRRVMATVAPSSETDAAPLPYVSPLKTQQSFAKVKEDKNHAGFKTYGSPAGSGVLRREPSALNQSGMRSPGKVNVLSGAQGTGEEY